ncbi:MAG: glycosyltransferase family 2 protein [Lachnospiraceae bacterium]|nr:glycosyltransferase family 2 protein [Lachnospiraceae bacterium]
MITISLCMIVKNEERILSRCLDSIADIMDEIIIVDTGSTDKTKEIAARYTDKIYDFEWIDDFAAARNFSFSKATMDYIYTADADEILDEVNRERFKTLKAHLLPEIDIVQMKYCNQLEYNTTYNFDVELRGKLYKRLRTFYYEDPVHEVVRTSPIVFDSDIEIIHKPESLHAGRDFKTFQKAYKKNGFLSNRLHELYARELYIAGKDDDFIEAVSFFEASMTDDRRTEKEVLQAACVLSHAYRISHDIEKLFKCTIKGVTGDSCSELTYELGEYFFEKEDYKEATIWYYNSAFSCEPILNIRYAKEYPLKKLVECYRTLGDHENEALYKDMLDSLNL